MPAWLREVAESACECCVCPVRGRATGLAVAWSPPGDSEYGCWLVDVRPERFEVVGGPDDGTTGYSPVFVDLPGCPAAWTRPTPCTTSQAAPTRARTSSWR